MGALGGVFDASSSKATTNTSTEQTTQDLTGSSVDNLNGLEDSNVVESSGGSVLSEVHTGKNSTITVTDGGAIEGANEATLAALDNTALLAADTTGKLLGANDNITALAGVTVDNNTALAGEVVSNNTALAGDVVENNTALAGQAIDDLTALSGVFSDNMTALAGKMMGGANASAQAAASAANSSIALAGNSNDNIAALAGKNSDNITALSGKNSDNITALAGKIVENSNSSTDTFADFATGAHNNNTALAGMGFNALNTNNEQSLAVLSNIASDAMSMAETGMGAIKDTAGMGFSTAKDISGMGFTTNENISLAGLAELGKESSESKTALTTMGGYALATYEKQFDTAMTELGMSNRSAQADIVSIAGRSADLMSDTLGNVLTNGQVSMQQTSNEGMKVIGWVAGAAVAAVILLTAVKG